MQEFIPPVFHTRSKPMRIQIRKRRPEPVYLYFDGLWKGRSIPGIELEPSIESSRPCPINRLFLNKNDFTSPANS